MGKERTWKRKHIYLYVALLIFLLSCAPLEKLKERMTGQEDVRHHLLQSQELLAQEDFEGALRENQKVISISSGKPPEDEALFNMGLIYAHPGNPKRNDGISTSFFKNLIDLHPQSPLVPKSKIWMGMLQENEILVYKNKILTLKVEKLNETVQKTKEKRQGNLAFLSRGQELFSQGDFEGALRENQKVISISSGKAPEDEALFNMGLIYAHPGNPRRDYAKSLGFFGKLMKDHPQSPLTGQVKIWTGLIQENEKLNKTIEKLHNVIEESKQVDIQIEEKKREKGK